MTKSQQGKIEFIKSQLLKDIERQNKRYNTDHSLTFEEIKENEYFATLNVDFHYNSEKPNIFNDQSIQLFIGKRGGIKGFKNGFSKHEEIKKGYQIYFV